jgi:hypothetical protein
MIWKQLTLNADGVKNNGERLILEGEAYCNFIKNASVLL